MSIILSACRNPDLGGGVEKIPAERAQIAAAKLQSFAAVLRKEYFAKADNISPFVRSVRISAVRIAEDEEFGKAFFKFVAMYIKRALDAAIMAATKKVTKAQIKSIVISTFGMTWQQYKMLYIGAQTFRQAFIESKAYKKFAQIMASDVTLFREEQDKLRFVEALLEAIYFDAVYYQVMSDIQGKVFSHEESGQYLMVRADSYLKSLKEEVDSNETRIIS